jgi:hypothetical protein
VALVGILSSLASISDCLSPVVARDYLPCGVLSAHGSITSKKAKYKVAHYPLFGTFDAPHIRRLYSLIHILPKFQ